MARRRTEHISFMTNSPGTERHLVVHRFGRAGARPKVYMQAAIHANELPGVMALHHLLPMLDKAAAQNRIKGEIIVVPSCNPIGYAQFQGSQHLGRYHFLGRDNFNRNHHDLSEAVAAKVEKQLSANPDRNIALIRRAALEAANEIEVTSEIGHWRKILIGMSIDADYMLDLHCDVNAALHLFISEGGQAEARILGAELGAAAIMYNSPYPTTLTFSGVNGALWSRLAERFPNKPIPEACFSVTVEFRGQGDVTDETGAKDAAGLFNYLTRVGAVTGRAGNSPRLKCQVTPMSGMDVGYAPNSGMLTYKKQPGDKIRKGETICEIIDPLAGRKEKRVAIKASTDGILFSRHTDGLLTYPGMVLFRLAGPKPLAHRIGKTGLDD